MRRKLSLLLICLMAAGCAGRRTPAPSAPAAAPEPAAGTAPAPEPPAIPGPLGRSDPTALTMDEVQAGLRAYLNETADPVTDKLTALFSRWYPNRDPRSLWAEADLDGDSKTEIATVIRLGGKPEQRGLTGAGALFVIYRKDGRWDVDRNPGEEVPGAALHAVADLTGDGRPEIVWSQTTMGAHTSHSNVYVSNWSPGRFNHLRGEMRIAEMKLSLEGRDILLRGGLIGSVGAGGAQREWVDRYRWMDDRAFRQVDRQYEPSDLGYHRLMDGMAAEQFGRTADAEQAYREAMDPAREAVAGMLKEGQDPQQFTDALRTFARIRLAALLLKQGRAEEGRKLIEGADGPFAGAVRAMAAAPDGKAACAAAARWAGEHSEFLGALNGLYGYANPQWTADTLCGFLPPTY